VIGICLPYPLANSPAPPRVTLTNLISLRPCVASSQLADVDQQSYSAAANFTSCVQLFTRLRSLTTCAVFYCHICSSSRTLLFNSSIYFAKFHYGVCHFFTLENKIGLLIWLKIGSLGRPLIPNINNSGKIFLFNFKSTFL
jgi:hypothetical protein